MAVTLTDVEASIEGRATVTLCEDAADQRARGLDLPEHLEQPQLHVLVADPAARGIVENPYPGPVWT